MLDNKIDEYEKDKLINQINDLINNLIEEKKHYKIN